MNIGIVTYWFERGAAYVSRAYMEALSKEHNVFIYSRGGEETGIGDPRWNLDNVTWGRKLKNIDQGKYIVWSDFKKWLKNNKIDIILFNEQQSWDIILRLRNSKYIIGAYVDYYTYETAPWFKLYDFLFCNTKRHFEAFQQHEQCYLVQWGADTTVCKPRPRADKSEDVVFFHSAGMGGINLRKGTDLLVKSFKNVHGPARLIIHSQVGLDRYAESAKLIKEDPRIQFIQGNYPLPGLYHLGDVYVYPSKLEGIGLSVAEAMACGLPVITTNAAPMNEFVENGRTGSLVDVAKKRIRSDGYYWPESYCSVENLTQRMQSYVDDPVLVKTQGQNARNAAVTQFNWEINSKDIGALLTRVKRARTWTPKYLKSIRRFEMAGNFFLQDARQMYAQGRIGPAWNSISRLLVRQPLSIVDREVWRVIRQLLTVRKLAGRQEDLIGRLSIKRTAFLPSRIRNWIVFQCVKRYVQRSLLFDPQWYFENNADVQKTGIDPLLHYLTCGASEGRNPSSFFNGTQYLASNPDVQRSGVNPLVHYLYFGKKEGRARFQSPLLPDRGEADSTGILTPGNRELGANDPTHGAVDIFLRPSGGLSDIQACIRSVMADLGSSDRLILIDDGLKKSTSEYLAYLRRILPENVELLQTRSGYALPDAMNQAISRSSAEFVAFLESDSVFPQNWLSKMIGAAALDPSIAIVSPLSSRSFRQTLASMGLGDSGFDERVHADPTMIERINRNCESLSEEVGFAIAPFVQGPCLLVKREVFQKLGISGGEAQIVFSEPKEFCDRAAEVGYHSLIATNVFIYNGLGGHRGSREKSQESIKLHERTETKNSANPKDHAEHENCNQRILNYIYTDIFLKFADD